MDEIIGKLKTPSECYQLAKNVLQRNPNLAMEARRRAVELKAISKGLSDGVEFELYKAVYAYEEALTEKNKKTTHASRTWQMIERHGIVHAAERAVDRKLDTPGYKLLIEMGMPDLTFESVIVRYPDAFNEEAVSRSRERLKQLSEI
jgi:hypothetical protein